MGKIRLVTVEVLEYNPLYRPFVDSGIGKWNLKLWKYPLIVYNFFDSLTLLLIEGVANSSSYIGPRLYLTGYFSCPHYRHTINIWYLLIL